MTSRRVLDALRQQVVAQKTGVLDVASPSIAGVVVLVKGAIVHATSGRADGEKALVRLLATKDATASFVERAPGDARTITSSTAELLAASAVAMDELAELRAKFSGEAPLVAADPGPPTVSLSRAKAPEEISTAARSLLHFLRSPITVVDLLDSDPGSDHEILTALAELDRAGRVRSLASAKTKVAAASAGDLARIERALEAKNAAFAGTRARLVIAGAPHRLAIVSHNLTCFEGATAPADPPPTVPMPHVAVRWTRDRVDVDLVVCPLVPAYSPLWPMTLGGAHAALRLDSAAREIFDRACASAGVRTVDAASLLPSHDDTKVEDVAALVRGALGS